MVRLFCIASASKLIVDKNWDEFHQLYVPGRAGTVFDVGVDSLGALAGLLILAGILALVRHRKAKMVSSH